MLPCLVFEDEHLLVVDKPPGLNTHAPSPYAGEGIYDWLRHREPRWAKLAIIHRLDKQTSGLLLFSKTALANRSLTRQFTERSIRKKYIFLTDRTIPALEVAVKSLLIRAGEKYVSRTLPRDEKGVAETRFRVIQPVPLEDVAAQVSKSAAAKIAHRHAKFAPRAELKAGGTAGLETRATCNRHWVEAEPLTGRTHQIRVHAADSGFPILGDVLYGGTKASRVFLHATQLTIRHPASDELVVFDSPPTLDLDPAIALRAALIDEGETNAWRLCHGASDAWPGWYVDRASDFLLSQSKQVPSASETEALRRWQNVVGAGGVSHKIWSQEAQGRSGVESSPLPILGRQAPERFVIRENGLSFEQSFLEGYSIGLFFDQRDNRRRVLQNHIAADFPLFARGPAGARVLNTFAYTCGFSVCAAKGGARATSLDLSKKYLEWGKRNFELNGLTPDEHNFIFGDVFDWLPRLARQQKVYDAVLLDPPTFSQSKRSGAFRAEKDYGKLVGLTLPLLKAGGVLFASTNAATWAPERFLAAVQRAVESGSRRVLQTHYAPQPPDFPISREEPAYLKTVWLRIG